MGEEPYITVVSGLPRSGTSLVMQLLHAGGHPILADDSRPTDTCNPKGYFEYAPVKRLKDDHSWLGQAQGKAVKIVSPLLETLPDTYAYKVLFIQRPLDAVIASQNAMIRQQGGMPETSDAAVLQAYDHHLSQVKRWLVQQPHMDTLFLSYTDLLQDTESQLMRIVSFLNRDLDKAAMQAVIDPELNHH